MKRKKIFEYELNITKVADSGISLNDILSGAKTVPQQGLRIDVHFDGHASGEIAGRVYGVDYIRLRADGRISLDIRAMIEIDAERRIAISADGVAVVHKSEPVADLFENVTLSTTAPDYTWVNVRQIWSVGTVNFSTGKIVLAAYAQ